MFGGENNTSLANDLWTLRGLGLDGEEAPAWIPLELPGTAPAPRKGHSCTCKQDAIVYSHVEVLLQLQMPHTVSASQHSGWGAQMLHVLLSL